MYHRIGSGAPTCHHRLTPDPMGMKATFCRHRCWKLQFKRHFSSVESLGYDLLFLTCWLFMCGHQYCESVISCVHWWKNLNKGFTFLKGSVSHFFNVKKVSVSLNSCDSHILLSNLYHILLYTVELWNMQMSEMMP